MPIYEFECPVCSKKVEEVILAGEQINVVCEKCGIESVRLISAPRMKTETRGMFGKVRDKWKHTLNADADVKESYASLERQGKLKEVNDKDCQSEALNAVV